MNSDSDKSITYLSESRFLRLEDFQDFSKLHRFTTHLDPENPKILRILIQTKALHIFLNHDSHSKQKKSNYRITR